MAMQALVTTEWLASELGADDLRVLDATYFGSVPGGPGGDPAADFGRHPIRIADVKHWIAAGT